jgi:hypothetical protein
LLLRRQLEYQVFLGFRFVPSCFVSFRHADHPLCVCLD